MVPDERLLLLPGMENSVKTGSQELVQHGFEFRPGRISHGLEVGTGDLGFDFSQVCDIERNTLLDFIFSGDGHEVKQADVCQFPEKPVEG